MKAQNRRHTRSADGRFARTSLSLFFSTRSVVLFVTNASMPSLSDSSAAT